uniref:Uncharacterized protein n=1 Tax=Anguilla anguilla TaxID=7936 RepID=A0A0E9SIJ9_ANGAN
MNGSHLFTAVPWSTARWLKLCVLMQNYRE